MPVIGWCLGKSDAIYHIPVFHWKMVSNVKVLTIPTLDKARSFDSHSENEAIFKHSSIVMEFGLPTQQVATQGSNVRIEHLYQCKIKMVSMLIQFFHRVVTVCYFHSLTLESNSL